MTTIPRYRQIASLFGAIALLLQNSPVMAEGHGDNNRPVAVTFTKWVSTAVPPYFLEGIWGGDLDNTFVGEVLQIQFSVNPALNGIIRLEAIYEVQNGNRSFTALVRGGQNSVTGAAQLDGVILAGWRTGAPVHAEYQAMQPGAAECDAAHTPEGNSCFVGTIHVGRAPRD